MADPPSFCGPESDSPDEETTPRWVTVSWTLVIALLLLFVVLHLASRGLGDHVPGP